VNKKTDEMPENGGDWRSDAESSLGRIDPATAARRPRGRPKGAMNKKTHDFAAWYEAQGFKDPLQLMAEFMSSDPVALQAWHVEYERTQKAVGKAYAQAVPSLAEIRAAQMSAAAEIAPYLHGKAPVRLEITDERLPVLVINAGTNQLEQAQSVAASRGLSVGRPLLELKHSKINDLADRSGESSTARSSKGAKDE
jgi:hypothetical protein